MLYVFRTATAGQKAFMEGLMKDTGNIRKLNEPGLFGATNDGLSREVLAAIKDAGIVVDRYGSWIPLLALSAVPAVVLAWIGVLPHNAGVAAVGAIFLACVFGLYRLTAKFGDAAFPNISFGGARDDFKWASKSNAGSYDDGFYRNTGDPSDCRSHEYSSRFWND